MVNPYFSQDIVEVDELTLENESGMTTSLELLPYSPGLSVTKKDISGILQDVQVLNAQISIDPLESLYSPTEQDPLHT